LFIVFDRDASMHKGIGGGVFTAERIVFSQIGPLFIIGLLDRQHLSVADLDVWSHSKLLGEGGTIKPISAWRVGTELTLDCARFLARHDSVVKRRVLEMANRSKKWDVHQNVWAQIGVVSSSDVRFLRHDRANE
jgi:hypothetical protein